MRVMRLTNGRWRRKGRHAGQALMELSLVLVFLIILTMGLIQYGVLASTNNTLVQLSRDAGRYAAQGGSSDTHFNVVSGTPTTSWASWAQYLSSDCGNTSLKYSDLSASVSCSGTICPQPPPPGTPFTITLSYDMTKKMFLPVSFVGFGVFANKVTMSTTMIVQ